MIVNWRLAIVPRYNPRRSKNEIWHLLLQGEHYKSPGHCRPRLKLDQRKEIIPPGAQRERL